MLYLDSTRFIDFMRLMRDGEGVFAVDAAQKLPNYVRKLDERTLRSVLGHYGLSKSYLWALDKDALSHRALLKARGSTATAVL